MPSSEQDEAPVSGNSVKQLRLDTFNAVASHFSQALTFDQVLEHTDALYA